MKPAVKNGSRGVATPAVKTMESHEGMVQPLFWGGALMLAGGLMLYASPDGELNPATFVCLGGGMMGLAALIDSAPDIKRYLEIKAM